MKFLVPLFGLAVLAACTGAAPTATQSTTPTPAVQPTTPTSADNTAFRSLLNNVRTANGAADVAFDARLAAAAQAHADDMTANGFFSHTGSNGSSVGDRATAAGYTWRNIGENIAQGQQSEAEAMTSWTNSPGHHANNINPNFEDFGLAKSGSGANTNWVLVLGRD